MKICIAGKNNIAVSVCSYLLKKYPDIPILVVKNRTDNGTDSFQRSFWNSGINFLSPYHKGFGWNTRF